tara:strand:- start:1276 stop:1689 length:414 start_codon:yes stop_codon:yes gene_type:complete
LSNKISDKDKKDWEDFLSEKEKLPNKDLQLKEKNLSKLITYDLHGYSLDEANTKVESLITKSYQSGVKKLIIVTGKGLHSDNEKNPYLSKELGILKYSVPEFIRGNSELMKMINEIKDAPNEDGGSGAFYILLKKEL